jgi:hypothetical protein
MLPVCLLWPQARIIAESSLLGWTVFEKPSVVQVIGQTEKTRRPLEKLDLPRRPGLYGIFLAPTSLLPGFATGGELLYVGKAQDSLCKRISKDHFKTGTTGRSPVRRSLGAALRTAMDLRVMPRSACHKPIDFYNYKFSPEGEKRLTAWMECNLEVGFSALDCAIDEIKESERAAIGVAAPILNLAGNKAATSAELRLLRAECCAEARKNAESGG